MIIKRITIKRLRAIKGEKTIELSPGLNIIKGSDNEAGKTSLRIAITKALFQDPTTSRDEIQALTSWGTDEPWEVSLEFESNGISYRITKSFKDKSGELVASGPQQFVAKNKNTIADKIAEVTGCPSESFFLSTACIGQEELIKIIPENITSSEKQNAIGTIDKRLQSKLSGAEGVDVSAIINRLNAKTHRKDANGPYRRLLEISERIAELRAQKQDQEKKGNDIIEKRRNLNRVREELEKINRELPDKQDVIIKNKRISELQEEIARDKAQYENFKKAQEFKSHIDNLDNELKAYSPFVEAGDRIARMESTENKLDGLSHQVDSSRNDLNTIKAQKPALWPLISGAVLVLGGLAGLITSQYISIVAVAGLLLLTYWLITRRTWKKQMNSVEQKLESLESEYRKTEEEAQRQLEGFGCRDYDEFLQRLAEYRSRAEARRDLAGKLDTLLAGKGWAEYLKDNTELDIQTNAGMKELAHLQPFKLEPLPLQRLENEVSRLQTEKGRLEQEQGGLDKFLEYTDSDRDQLTDIEEELKGLEEQKEFWEKTKKVYDITREALEEAHKQALSNAKDLLENEISRYISIVTEGRYSQVKLNERDLSISTLSPEKNDWVDVVNLSRATQDQFYLCARFALVRLITEGKRPPLLLDDPFVNFHAKRLRNTIPLLQEIARENQILLFTCGDNYDFLGKVISLD